MILIGVRPRKETEEREEKQRRVRFSVKKFLTNKLVNDKNGNSLSPRRSLRAIFFMLSAPKKRYVQHNKTVDDVPSVLLKWIFFSLRVHIIVYCFNKNREIRARGQNREKSKEETHKVEDEWSWVVAVKVVCAICEEKKKRGRRGESTRSGEDECTATI